MNWLIMLCIRFRSCLSLRLPNSDGLVAILLTMSAGVLGRLVGVLVVVVGVGVGVAAVALAANGRTVGMVGRRACAGLVVVVLLGSASDWKLAGNGRARGGDGGGGRGGGFGSRCRCCC